MREGYCICVSRGATRAVRSGRNQLEIIGNQLEITEIWLEIRNHGLENPVEIRKSARNHEKSGKKSRETHPFCLSMRSRSFAHAHLRNPREISHEISWKSVGNHSEGSWKSQKSGNLVRREGPCRTPRSVYLSVFSHSSCFSVR